jgi:2-polyprenyl-3-methyl-5-hydroxy-6-metoxy-1,4-benzoquinol methylase
MGALLIEKTENDMTVSSAVDEALNCPYCLSVSFADFTFSGRSYCRCPSCSLIFAEQGEDNKTVIAYYRDRYFDAGAQDQISEQRQEIFCYILTVLAKFQKPGSLLDVGCGCGFFLNEAKARGWQVMGVDPSRKSIDYARSLIGEAALCGTIDDIPADRRFDVIALVNVLDHMVDFRQQLKKIYSLLAPDGILYLRFPNGLFHSSVMRLFRILSAERFINSFLIFHEYAFTPKVIRRCLHDMGFIDIRVLNAPLTGGHLAIGGGTLSRLIRNILKRLTWAMFKFLEVFSMGRWAWGPSLQIIARRGTGDRRA